MKLGVEIVKDMSGYESFCGNIRTIFLNGIGIFPKELEPSHEETTTVTT